MLCRNILFIFTLIVPIYTFNFDVNHAILYDNPFENGMDQYFGYSVILYPGDNITGPWVQISAPNDFNQYLNHSGSIYRCAIKEEKCTVLVFQQDIESAEIWNGAWLGNTMDIDLVNKKYVICAHRWTYTINNGHNMKGLCYWAKIKNDPIKLTPNIHNRIGVQAGFSAHLTRHKYNSELLLGAPGAYNFRGTSLVYRNSIPIKNTRQEFSDLNIIEPAKIKSVYASHLLGYAVTSGYFFSQNELVYAAGAPRAHNLQGLVLVYTFAYRNLMGPNEICTVLATKPQIGEYFGSTLSTGDINNDGYDDLIVGAPYYKSNLYNEGRVFIYLGSAQKKFQNPARVDILYGKEVGGEFGKTITVLGDIDLDGFSDVAIAAPFANNGRGIVYIYRGNKHGLDDEPTQIVKASDIYFNLRGFGISISKATDIDKNYYDDIAIGAFTSGQTILFRSQPIVSLHQSLVPSLTQISEETSQFKVLHCIWYSGPFLSKGINVTRNILVDPRNKRVTFNDETLMTHPTNRVRLEKEEVQVCKYYLVNITNILRVSTDPLVVKANLELLSDATSYNIVHITSSTERKGNDTFCKECPVFNPYNSQKEISIEIPFSLGCTDLNFCLSNLDISVELENVKNDTFIIGQADNIKLVTRINNTGENAYLTNVEIKLPNLIYFLNTPKNCDLKISSKLLRCQIADPLGENESKELILHLDMSKINNYESKSIETFNLYVTVFTSSKNSNGNTTVNKELKLFQEADISLTGKSDQQSYSYGNFTFGISHFTQIYQVHKFGASPIFSSTLNINVPNKIVLKNGTIVEFLMLFAIDPSINVKCETNITTIYETVYPDSNSDFQNGDIESRTNHDNGRHLLKKRDISEVLRNSNDTESKIDEILEDFSSNRKFHLNCNNTNIHCSQIICHIGSLIGQQNSLVLPLKMIINLSILKDVLEKNGTDIVVLSTEGNIHINNPMNFIQTGNRSDSRLVSTIFIGPSPKYIVALWIVILFVILSLLLLLVIVVVLYKFGFFTRQKKLELEALKMAAVSYFIMFSLYCKENFPKIVYITWC